MFVQTSFTTFVNEVAHRPFMRSSASPWLNLP